jgi:hypothetical protein
MRANRVMTKVIVIFIFEQIITTRLILKQVDDGD